MVIREAYFNQISTARQSRNQKVKTDFTTKDTKNTKFKIMVIRTLRGLRELRG